jgi:hypothetical protein
MALCVDFLRLSATVYEALTGPYAVLSIADHDTASIL